MRITLTELRKIINEETVGSRDVERFIEWTAEYISEADGEVEASDIAMEVFRPSDDETVRELRDSASQDDPAVVAAVEKYSEEYGVDPEYLTDMFFEALNATDEYMDDDDF
jgi:hypothetical protein